MKLFTININKKTITVLTLMAVAISATSYTNAQTSTAPENFKDVYARYLSLTSQRDSCLYEEDNSFTCIGENKSKLYFEFTPLKYIDLDDNGVKDLVAKSVESIENSNYAAVQLHFFMLDDNKQLQPNNYHLLLMYSQGTYQELDVKDIQKNGTGTRITASVSLTDKNLDGVADNRDAQLSFIWKDGMVFEETYLTQCAMAKITDKRIFNDDVDDISRKTTINDLDYTQQQEESITQNTSRDKVTPVTYRAKFYGCDNLNLSFSIDGTSVTDALTTLAKITRYGDILNSKAIQEYTQNPEPNGVLYSDSWVIRISHSGTASKSNVTINLIKRSDPEEPEIASHWNTVLRLKEF